jgi:hypothetical protein
MDAMSIMANTSVYTVEIILSRMDLLVSCMSYTEFKPFIIARNPLPADHSAVITVTEINVPEFVLWYISVTIRTISELNALGKICITRFSIVLSFNEKKGTILNRNIIKGKKEMMIKKAACAEKADTWSSLTFLKNILIILMVGFIILCLNPKQGDMLLLKVELQHTIID